LNYIIDSAVDYVYNLELGKSYQVDSKITKLCSTLTYTDVINSEHQASI